MEFPYIIIEEKIANINFEDIYKLQVKEFIDNWFEFDNPEDIEDVIVCLYEIFEDNVDTYLSEIGFEDICKNYDYYDDVNGCIINDICTEYYKWLDDNYNPADFIKE